MLEREYQGQNCSIARALEIVGERWTLLIIRDVFLGLRRFDQFQESLGIARNVLTDRLNWLVGEGILERVRYSERPRRHEYQLTPKGSDLLLPLTALRQWGDKYLSEKPPTLVRRKNDKKPVVVGLVATGADELRAEQVELVPGPGATPGQDLWWRDDRNDGPPGPHRGRLSHGDPDATSR
jgi:DNA-binding HxlR family transcriptional regulator